ncbi:unnamed protein product [Trifolium pratense]|uniref:Uncharacterized protein n=1 Tax=Trifolium pratense TaxID=57577 RepID=A0ACB0LFF1_TRIPR|nr:unnamed protein product [Trifolium pratense]
MDSSKKRFTRSGIKKILSKRFETVVDSRVLSIPLPANFCKIWRLEIEKGNRCWIKFGDHRVEISFHLSCAGNYLASGKDVSKEFAFAHPTRVLLEYNSTDSEFMMKVLGRVSEYKKEIINVDSSDDESHEDKSDFVDSVDIKGKFHVNKPLIAELNDLSITKKPAIETTSKRPTPFVNIDEVSGRGESRRQPKGISGLLSLLDGVHGWKKVVTAADVRQDKPQVMHFPKKVAMNALDKKQTSIMVQTKRNGKFIKCRILTAKRNKFEKYISKDWRKVMKEISVEVGDILICRLSTTGKCMLVFNPYSSW